MPPVKSIYSDHCGAKRAVGPLRVFELDDVWRAAWFTLTISSIVRSQVKN